MEKLRKLKIGRKYRVKSFERLIKEYGKPTEKCLMSC